MLQIWLVRGHAETSVTSAIPKGHRPVTLSLGSASERVFCTVNPMASISLCRLRKGKT